MNIEDIKKELLNTTDTNKIKDIISELHPRDVAEIIVDLNDELQDIIINSLSEEDLAEVLSFIDSEDSSEILEDISIEKAAAIIEEMEADDASDVLDEMDESLVQKIKKHLKKDTLEDLAVIDSYEEGTAGSLMNPNFIKILSNTSVKDAFKQVGLSASDAEIIDSLFIVDEKDILIGVVDLKELIIARMPKTVNEIMLENFACVDVLEDSEVAAKIVREYNVKALPVLKDGVIQGIITMDDAFDTYTEEAEEDYAKLAGLTEDEEENESIFSSMAKRIPWLAILLIMDIVVALVISRFDNVISHLTILTFFQTAVLGLSGNCGTQSLAVSVRNLSIDKDEKKLLKHIGKEMLQGLGLGLILAIFAFIFVVAMLLIKNSLGEDLTVNFIHQVGLVLCFSVFASVFVANLIGSIIPIIFYKLKIDPAVASGPFISTINDIISVVIYFGTALLVLGMYLG